MNVFQFFREWFASPKLRASDLHQGMKVALGCGSIATVERVEIMDGTAGDTAIIRGVSALRIHFRDHAYVVAHPSDIIAQYSEAAMMREMVAGPMR